MIVGLDPSLTATGFVWRDSAKGGGRACIGTKPGDPIDRVLEITERVLTTIDTFSEPYIVMEAPIIFGPHVNSAASLIGLNYCLQVAFRECDWPVALVAPSSLKLFATGKGNAGKDQVLAAAVRAGYEGSNNNEADAWWLCEMGLAHRRTRHSNVARETLPLTKQRALNVIAWPPMTMRDLPDIAEYEEAK